MSQIIISDLNASKDLDMKALTRIRGGFDWNRRMPGKVWGGPVSSTIKDLTNINTQLNIAVLSEGVFQGNSNSVAQF